MILRRNLLWLEILFFLLTFFYLACASGESTLCEKDLDCPKGQHCQKGHCQTSSDESSTQEKNATHSEFTAQEKNAAHSELTAQEKNTAHSEFAAQEKDAGPKDEQLLDEQTKEVSLPKEEGQCQIGTKRCSNGQEERCTARQSGSSHWELVKRCACGCRDAQICKETLCQANVYDCQGNILRQCAPTGCSWKAKQTCKTANHCHAKIGQCGSFLRSLYLYPKDKKYRKDYALAIQRALVDLQGWYKNQLGGKTFFLYNQKEPESCQLAHKASYYARNSWTKVMQDVQACAKVTYKSPIFTWILYVDVIHECKAPGRLGAGTTGVTIMARQDLQGLSGQRRTVDDCGKVWEFPVTRWIGGAGHELGHAFGLPHPPGCDQGKPTCDAKALMWAGYASYPNTYLRADEKKVLLASPFFR